MILALTWSPTSTTLITLSHKPLLNNNIPKTTINPTKRFTPRAQKNQDNNNKTAETKIEEDEVKKKNGRPRLNLRWVDLVLDPDPDNVVAVGLTGVLAWASVQVLWQLFFISFSILVAAAKYSFIAALLVFILITLL